MDLDVDFARSQFPVFSGSQTASKAFFENAGGSFACRQTIDALNLYYTQTKVQPYASYPASAKAGALMDRSRSRWAEALGVETSEVNFGPSTSMNTYVLANAFGAVLRSDDEVIVTNQDHEANTGAVRRMAERVGAKLIEWPVDKETGLLDPEVFEALLSERTALVAVPHCSNIVGQENPVARITALAHRVGARVIVDGVSFAPHTVPDVGALDADVYLFSLYKTYSVHQGLMVVRNGLIDELPNQGHYFNADRPERRLTPAGPDHAQEAAAGAVLDYVQELADHHSLPAVGLRQACAEVSTLWREHENTLTEPALDFLAATDQVRLLGPAAAAHGGHRCPTIAFSPIAREPQDVAGALVDRGIQTSHGHYYATRVLTGMGIDPERGVVRVSAVHYTSPKDIARLLTALEEVLK